MKSQVNSNLTPSLTTAPDAFPAGKDAVDAAALNISQAPGLDGLPQEQLDTLIRPTIGYRYIRDLDRRADLAGIDYPAEKAAFLDTASRTRSPHTRKAYAAGLDRLDAYTARRAFPVLALSPALADDWTAALAASGLASASVRRDVAAASSFFTWLERRHQAIRNPFRGSKARPAKRAAKPAAYPDAEAVETILDALAEPYRAAAAVLALRGLRAGGLPELTIWGSRFKTRSKGKDIAGELPPEALEAIRAGRLDIRAPFAGLSASKIEDAIRKTSRKLFLAGALPAPYSAHDLRHFYATTEYAKDRDLRRVSKLLGHASIQVTETYLRGLGEID